jgi:hypothetical protein
MTAEVLTESIPDTAATPARNKGGAPKGNRSAIRNGARSFVLGRYPAGCSYIARSTHLLRSQLRSAVATQDGSTSVWSEAVIASACQHEGRRLLLLRWLRLEGDKLGTLDRATLLDRIGKATDQRDRCLQLLGLDKKPEPDWYAMIPEPSQPAPLPAPATLDAIPEPSDVPAPDAPSEATSDSQETHK